MLNTKNINISIIKMSWEPCPLEIVRVMTTLKQFRLTCVDAETLSRREFFSLIIFKYPSLEEMRKYSLTNKGLELNILEIDKFNNCKPIKLIGGKFSTIPSTYNKSINKSNNQSINQYYIDILSIRNIIKTRRYVGELSKRDKALVNQCIKSFLIGIVQNLKLCEYDDLCKRKLKIHCKIFKIDKYTHSLEEICDLLIRELDNEIYIRKDGDKGSKIKTFDYDKTEENNKRFECRRCGNFGAVTKDYRRLCYKCNKI